MPIRGRYRTNALARRDLARAAHTSYQTIWRIEQKHAEPGVHLASRLARALHCSLDYLCDLYADAQRQAPGKVDAWRLPLPAGPVQREIAPAAV
jgi:DNA-binding XRE family transcriptional regulator